MQRAIPHAAGAARPIVLMLLAGLGVGSSLVCVADERSTAAPPPAQSNATPSSSSAAPPPGAPTSPTVTSGAPDAAAAAAAAAADIRLARAKEFAKRYRYRVEMRGDTVMLCREEKATGSRVRAQRRCVTEDAARQEAENAVELLDRTNRGFTPRDGGT
jgi:hypothetical protein